MKGNIQKTSRYGNLKCLCYLCYVFAKINNFVEPCELFLRFVIVNLLLWRWGRADTRCRLVPASVGPEKPEIIFIIS